MHDALTDAELLIFDDEGHGFHHHRNQLAAYGRALEFVTQRVTHSTG